MGSRIADTETAVRILRDGGEEFAIVDNPSYVFPPHDLYPLPPKADVLAGSMAGAVMDMDGTTTTTEPLCLHALEHMVRRITGRDNDTGWAGLDRDRDYPHIIGNSTTKHVEYLVRTYAEDVHQDAMRTAYIDAVLWTLARGADEGRKEDVRANCAALGAGAMLADDRFRKLLAEDSLDTPDAIQGLLMLNAAYGPALRLDTPAEQVRAAVDIYYQRYHYILGRIAQGEGDKVAAAVFGSAGDHLIAPMTGIGVFLALLKGWLGDEAGFGGDLFRDHVRTLAPDVPDAELVDGTERLPALGRYFEAHPARIAVVTSSIRYEARIVLGEVFRVLRDEVAGWPIGAERRERVLAGYEHFETFYDAFITASDSSEIRLKPHRDLYSIALHRMGIGPEAFNRVAGFEDSESGTVAIRAAGIACCCALPFPETSGHRFDAAAYVAQGGVPEVMLRKAAFLPTGLLTD